MAPINIYKANASKQKIDVHAPHPPLSASYKATNPSFTKNLHHQPGARPRRKQGWTKRSKCSTWSTTYIRGVFPIHCSGEVSGYFSFSGWSYGNRQRNSVVSMGSVHPATRTPISSRCCGREKARGGQAKDPSAHHILLG